MIEQFPLNEKLFYILNSFAGKSDFWDTTFVFFAEYVIFIIIIVFLFFFFRKIWEDKKIEAWELAGYFSAAVGAWFVAEIIKKVLPTERPFIALQDVVQLSSQTPLSSFPSGHATLSFALAVSVFVYNRRWGSVLLIAALCVSLGRVFVGVHFPLDIAVGALLGLIITLLCYTILKIFRKK